MPDLRPGVVREEDAWPGHWVSVARQEWRALLAEAGGPHGVETASAATYPDGQDYIWTAWARKGEDVPVLAREDAGCGHHRGECCPGAHSFWKFVPETEEDRRDD